MPDRSRATGLRTKRSRLVCAEWLTKGESKSTHSRISASCRQQQQQQHHHTSRTDYLHLSASMCACVCGGEEEKGKQSCTNRAIMSSLWMCGATSATNRLSRWDVSAEYSAQFVSLMPHKHPRAACGLWGPAAALLRYNVSHMGQHFFQLAGETLRRSRFWFQEFLKPLDVSLDAWFTVLMRRFQML